MVRALIVDDEDLVRHLCRRVLSVEGFEVYDAEDTLAARRIINNIGVPDILLLDISMPGASGLDFLKFFRRDVSSTVPVIMLTGNRYESDVRESFSSGANDYLLKPFMAGDIVKRVKASLKQTGVDVHPSPASDRSYDEEKLQSILDGIELGYTPEKEPEFLRRDFHRLVAAPPEILENRQKAAETWLASVTAEDISEGIIKLLDERWTASQISERLSSLLPREKLWPVCVQLLDRLDLLKQSLKSTLSRILIALGVFDELAAWCQSPVIDTRNRAVLFLHEIHHSRSRILLLERLEDPVPEIRTAAATGLRRYWDEDVWNALIEALNDPSPEVVRAASRSLAKSLPVEEARLLLPPLTTGGREVGRIIVRILQDIGFFSDFHRFLPLLGTTVRIIAQHIPHDPEFSRELLRAAREGETAEIQIQAIEALEQSELDGRMDVYQELLQASAPEVRERALRQLGQHWDDRLADVVAPMRYDPSPEVRITLVSIYAHLRKEQAVGLLRPFLKDVHPGVRGMAACSLHNMGDEAALEVLRHMLESNDPDLRVEGLRHLIAQGSVETLKPALGLLADRNETVRREAEQLFRELSKEEQTSQLRDLLPGLSEDVREPLSGILNDVQVQESAPPEDVPEAEAHLPQIVNRQYIATYRKIAGKPPEPEDTSGTDRRA